MQTNKHVTRGVALLTGGVLGASALLHAAPASADKAQNYKTGAIALGVASAYYVLKGKTVPGAVAGAGAYYAYKKGRDIEKEDDNGRYDYRYRHDYRSRYPESRYPDSYSRYPDRDRYPDDYGYGYGFAPQSGAANAHPVLK
jgi:hypothetical protein